MIAFPTKKYKTVVCDPPWKYGRNWDTGSSKSCFSEKHNAVSVRMPYPEMTVGEIASLPVPLLFDENCDVYLWTTQHHIRDAFYLLDAWDLDYCQLLTWCKTPMGTGQGGLFTPTTEFCILGRKGKMPLNKMRVDSTWWNLKRTGVHSKKPEQFQDIIESVSDSPRIELFARRPRLGWDVWGDEV